MTTIPTKGLFFRIVSIAILSLGIVGEVCAQYTSNKGKDFWVGYTDHIDGTGSNMVLYITSDVSTEGIVSIPGQSYSQTFTVTANSITQISIPSNKAYVGSSETVENRGIHVVANDDIIVYSHIYSNARSEATLVLPVPALGREYYAMTFEQKTVANHRRSQFMVIAIEDDTEVEITPSQNTLNGKSADIPFTVFLDSGECYQVQADKDLTGSKILSVSSTSGLCKKIAVFSGSGFTPLGCATAGSGDNLYEQLYPVSSWGKAFATAPLKTRSGDWYRVLVAENGTSVTINGSTGSYSQGDVIDFQTTSANYITATKPICVAQFARTQGCDNVTGDPFMIIIPPAEQGLDKITLYSSPNQNITGQYINIVMPTIKRSSFKIDNSSVSGWSVIPSNNNYSYVQINVSNGNHLLEADDNFVATAYGFGNVESYGYVAGSNVINLIQNISLSSDTVCNTKPVRFAGFAAYTPSSWLWDFGDGDTSHQANPSHIYQDTGLYTVTLVTTKSNGNDCNSKDSTSFELRVRTSPTANFDFESGCSNNPVFFSDSSESEATNPIFKWEWQFNDSTKSFEKDPSFTFNDGGTYTVKLIAFNKSYCSDTITKIVSLIHAPKTKFSHPDLCLTETANFVDSSTIGGGYSITGRKWEFGDGATSTAKNANHNYTLPGVYNVKLVEYSNSGCDDSLTVSIRKYPELKADFSVTSICFPDTVRITDKSLPDTGGITTWIWNFGDGTIDTMRADSIYAVKHFYNTYGTYNITLTVFNEIECVSITTKQVKVNYYPIADFEMNKNCQNEAIEFKDKSTVNTGNVTNWLWDFGDTKTDNTKNTTHQYDDKGIYNIRLIVTTNEGCKDTLIKQLKVHPAPVTDFNVGPACLGNEAAFTNTSAISEGNISGWKWDFGDHTSSTDKDPTHKFKDTATYTVKLTATSSEGCKETTQKTFGVYLLPEVDFSATNTCINKSIAFTNHSSIRVGSIANISWDLDDDINTTIENPELLYSKPGAKEVKLTITSDKGCKDSLIKTVQVYPKPDLAFIADGVCIGDETEFLNRSSILSGVILYYTWDFDDNTTSNYKEPDHTFANPGVYRVTMSGISDMGCKDTIQQNVLVNPYPKAAINFSPTAACRPATINFSGATSTIDEGTITKWDWELLNSGDTSAEEFSWIYTHAGTYSVSLSVTSDKGCTTKEIFNNIVTVYDLPTADFDATPDSVSSIHPDVRFTNLSSKGAFYTWTFGDGSPASNSFNTQHTYSDTGTFMVNLTVTDTKGCVNIISRKVYVFPDYTVFIPEIFSPNGDGLNDVFKPIGVFTGVVYYEMTVFNRWGEVIFNTKDLETGWNGRTGNIGEWAPTGAYVYVIKIKGYDKSITNIDGVINVAR